MLKTKLYHGTNAKFEEFDERFKGSNTDDENTVHGFFFTKKIEIARYFGSRIIEADLFMSKTADFRLHGIFSKKQQAPVIYEILFGGKCAPGKALRTLNEEIGLGEIGDMYESLNTVDANDLLRRNGYDSIISEMGDDNIQYTVFDKHQINITREFYRPQKQLDIDGQIRLRPRR